jgi:hypothetical protein
MRRHAEVLYIMVEITAEGGTDEMRNEVGAQL